MKKQYLIECETASFECEQITEVLNQNFTSGFKCLDCYEVEK